MARLKLLAAGLVLATAMASRAEEIGYLEDFALASDRAEALKQLIPGSEDYYYYHCLHLQNTEQFDQVEQLLAAWIKRYKYTPRVIEIQNRQALLTYGRDPAASLEYVRRRLDLQFNHQRETVGEKPNLPTRLDPALIGRDRLRELAFAAHQNLAGFEDSALDWLAAAPLNPDRRRHLLERLRLPDHAQLAQLVVDDLKHRYSKPFGALQIHRQLLLAQLDQCLELKPDLRDQTNFVNVYLTKLRPNDDVDWQLDAEQYEAYLERLWSFVETLAPAHNSLKAHVLYHRLVHDRSQGRYDKPRFMSYIRLPRNASYMEPKFMQLESSRRHPADLNADFSGVTLLPRVGNDEQLVRSYLHHFFLTETSTAPYEPYINDVFLRHNLAEAKIVNGLGEPEQWYSLLPPEVYQALKDRIDLDFVYTNPRRFAADQPVTLDLYVKNVRTLIVKVFEINTRNYYREQGREVNTDINLDGLVPNEEYTFQYGEPPLRRVQRHFEFPSLAQPGVYVIDFIGNGISSRAVVRKGKLRHLARTSTAGHALTILDEAHQKVDDASVWLAGHEYLPGDDGRVVIPFSTRPGRQPIVISRGNFSSLAFLNHQAENYHLAAGMYVDREALLARRPAQLLVRPALYLNGTPVTLSVLEDVRLTITSVDHDGVSSSKEVADFALFEDRETVYEFQTPTRLSQISFRLQAKVQNLSRNEKIDLATSESFSLNAIDQGDKIEDLHLAKIGGEYLLELRGKTGEPRPDRPVQLSLKHRDFTAPVQLTLQTDLSGRVALGPLAEIAALTATAPEGTSHNWILRDDRHTYHRSLHGVAGQPLAVPYMGSRAAPDRSELALLELRGGTYVANRFEALAIAGGMLQIGELPRGDYQLLLKDSGQRVLLRLAEGGDREGYVLGDNRHLEKRGRQPLQIAGIDVGQDELRIRLHNSSPFARVHVFATRYQPAFSAYDKLARIRDAEPLRAVPAKATALYAAGRNIGDELRYIIERQYAAKYPGVMLDRPSLLLNPWAVRSTETGHQEAQAGEDMLARPDAEAKLAEGEAAPRGGIAPVGDFANLDFLSEAAAVVLNLEPDEEGLVTVPRAALGAHHDLHVVAVDPVSTALRRVSLDEKPTDFLDLRLAGGLDPQRHFTQQKQISVVPPQEKLLLADLATAKYETYDTLARVYGLYATLSGDPHLLEFGFLLNWPNLTPEKKRQQYSQYACHELNFFLFKKDPDFFAAVVQPYIENKKDKTFLDRWLVGDPLDEFLRPWNYARLNVVERVLLAQRLAADREHTVRDVNDRFDLLPPDVDRFNFLFQTALKGSALEVSDERLLAEQLAAGGVVQLEGRLGGVGGAAAAAPPAAGRALGLQSAKQPAAAEKAAQEQLMGERMRRKLSEADVQELAEGFYDDKNANRERMRLLYRKLDKTQEWAENHYYQLPIEKQNAELVTVNEFWRDYANHQGGQPFYSPHFAQAAHNFPEMMFALALLDLPFTAGEHGRQLAEGGLTLTAASPLIVFHEEIRPAAAMADETPILVSQNFFRHGDRYRYENNQRLDKFVSDEFLAHAVYGCQVVVTNPTSSPQKLDVLLQIPAGAMPVLKGHPTRSVHVDLQPYHTQTIEYYFYFPAAGQYRHYPVHVAKNEQLLAHAAAVELTVVEELSRVDRESWQYISQNGREEDVMAYLTQHNLHRTQLDKIAFRMQDKQFFLRVVELLERRHAYDHTLWSYGIKHDVPGVIGQYLQHADKFVAECGAALNSPLLVINPVARKTYQHLDYRPLVNARAHQLGRRRQILNDRLYEQYHALLKVLSYDRELDAEDLMAVTYYLLLQDRFEDALAFFARVDAGQLPTRLQYDYFAGYLNLVREDVEAARQAVAGHLEHPVDRWRNAFALVGKQIDEISGGPVEVLDPESREQTQGRLAASEPGFDFQVEAKTVKLNYQNLDAVRVNYYRMDIELLFSRNPFVQQHSGQFSFIRPNLTRQVALPAGQTTVEFPLPEELHNDNVLVEIRAAGQTKSQAYYSNSLALQVVDNYGQLRVVTANPGRPLPKVYVKVYARMKDGRVRFYKDGYTDLRGRFDYASLNTNELDFVDKFSLLVMSPENGAVVREAAPPKQ